MPLGRGMAGMRVRLRLFGQKGRRSNPEVQQTIMARNICQKGVVGCRQLPVVSTAGRHATDTGCAASGGCAKPARCAGLPSGAAASLFSGSAPPTTNSAGLMVTVLVLLSVL